MFEPVPEPRAESEPIVYEQPLNERMRGFLRLEFLWQQLSYHAGVPNAWSSRSAVACLLEILAITSRGDARGDVLKELERQMTQLRDYQNRPGVDSARLRSVLWWALAFASRPGASSSAPSASSRRATG